MELISPKYRTRLIKEIASAIWKEFPTYQEAYIYIDGWHYVTSSWDGNMENFEILYKDLSRSHIDLLPTLSNMDNETLIKVAIDIGVDTPDFIPSIPTFRNEIKAEYPTASAILEKAYKAIESEPETAIGLANSALESIIKEILKDRRISTSWKETDTLHSLIKPLLKEFKLLPSADMPEEIKTIGSSLTAIAQNVEKLRSSKTYFHGKTDDDYVVSDPMYTYFVFNAVCTIALFLKSFYIKNYPDQDCMDDLPF